MNRRSPRIVYGLGSLLLLVLACCVAFAIWAANRQGQHAVCLLRVRPDARRPLQPDDVSIRLSSPAIMDSAATHPNVAPVLADEADPVMYLIDRFSAKRLGDTELLELRLYGDDPETTPIVLDGIVKTFLGVVAAQDSGTRAMRRTLEDAKSKKLGREAFLERIHKLPPSAERESVISTALKQSNGDYLDAVGEELTRLEKTGIRVQVVQSPMMRP